ncbi:hypothetical protein [Sphingobium sp. Ant17]|uniref:hypothetical protein n=1 Tax=Sphingobium sp. Ant17 TaxID=1461752 RepID=UPI00126925B8|nr:hypothetical protein [Sphingobium sp. Ant17]
MQSALSTMQNWQLPKIVEDNYSDDSPFGQATANIALLLKKLCGAVEALPRPIVKPPVINNAITGGMNDTLVSA